MSSQDTKESKAFEAAMSSALPKPIEEPVRMTTSDASVFYRIFLVDDCKYMEETFGSRSEAKRFLREQGLIRAGQIKRIRRSYLRGKYRGYEYKAVYYGARPGYFLDVWASGGPHTFLVKNKCLDSVKDVYAEIVAAVTADTKGDK